MRLSAAMVKLPGIEADFFRDTEYVGYSILMDKAGDGFPKPIKDNWPGLPWNTVDAAVTWKNGKALFFKDTDYVSFDIADNKVDAGYPKPIKANWPGVPAGSLDAVVLWDNGKAYFFKGTEYVRFDVSSHKADDGYPLPIKGNWPGLPWERIDTAVNWGNGKAYFFRDHEYVRYDLSADRVDAGYPKAIVDEWPGVLPVTVRTPFDVKKHGFHFTNHFDITPGLFGGVGGPFVLGLCGGMCAAALARYEQQKPVESLTSPPKQTCPELELFWELIERQLVTLYPEGGPKLVEFITSRNGSSGSEAIGDMRTQFTGIVTLSLKEWPRLRASLDAGKPIIVCLVRSSAFNDLSENHQVVAIGYQWAGGDHPTVFIYDPNHPDDEQSLTFSMGDKDSLHGVESDGKTMRGFFVIDVPPDRLKTSAG